MRNNRLRLNMISEMEAIFKTKEEQIILKAVKENIINPYRHTPVWTNGVPEVMEIVVKGIKESLNVSEFERNVFRLQEQRLLEEKLKQEILQEEERKKEEMRREEERHKEAKRCEEEKQKKEKRREQK